MKRLTGGYLRVEASRVEGDASSSGSSPSLSSQPGELPLPRYGLAGSFFGERWDEGNGWDVCEIAHRPVGSEEELIVIVRVVRRTTARHRGGGPRVAIPAADARCNVAIGLVLDNPSAGDDPFAAAEEVASEDQAWKMRKIVADGEVVRGYEREFGGRWVAYYLTPLLIVSVLAPVGLWLDEVVLRTLRPDEIGSMRLREE